MAVVKVFVDARRTFGGTERYTRAIVAALARTLPAESLVAFGRGTDDAGGPVPVHRGVARAGLGHLKRFVLDQWRLGHTSRRAGADVYHSLGAHVPPGLRVPAVATCFDLCPVERPETRAPGWMTEYERRAFVAGLRRAQHVVTLTDAVAAALRGRNLVRPEQVSVVYPPPPSFPAPQPFVAPQTAGPFFLCVGTIEPRKDLATVLRAHRRAFESCRIPLVVAGAYGWRQDEIRRRLSTPDPAVLWAGAVDDARLAWLYGRAAAVVQMSLDEGFSYPLVEAFAFGTPVVASDIPVHREVAGDAALFAPVGDAEAAAAGLLHWARSGVGERAAQAEAAGRRLDVVRRRSDVATFARLYKRLGAS